MKLHIWGDDNGVAIISPECLAASWLVSLVDDNIDVVTSCNTNMSKSGKLPVLVDDDVTMEGYEEISQFISHNCRFKQGSVTITPTQELLVSQQLINRSLINIIDEKLQLINQYNLYISKPNYEQFTRKLFKRYLPFPMMYSQPLKFYNGATEQVKALGIGHQPRLFNLTRDEEDDDEVDHTVPISKLHEQQLLAKNNQIISVRERKNLFRAVAAVEEVINDIITVLNFSYQLAESFTTSDLLLLSYLHAIYNHQLPDKTLHRIIQQNYEEFYTITSTNIDLLNSQLVPLNPPSSWETPSLVNEIKYRLNFLPTGIYR